jgi:hypothetical protein
MAPNADYIKFKGTIGQVEKAFDIQLVLPEYDRYAAKNEPAIAAKSDGVLPRIVALEEISKVRAMMSVAGTKLLARCSHF